jgi:hypothetical protein
MSRSNRLLIGVAIGLLVGFNILLLIQNGSLKSNAVAQAEGKFHLIPMQGVDVDGRGLYTYPGIGRVFYSFRDEEGFPLKPPPLTLAIFLVARSSCPVRLSEFEAYKRLLPTLEARGQKMIAITTLKDSAAIADTLKNRDLSIPLYAYAGDTTIEGLSFEQFGITHGHMPFKVVFDSTYTAIYMRGANNTPESQQEYEKAMLGLSRWVAEGKL